MTEPSGRDGTRSTIKQLLLNVGMQMAMFAVHLGVILWATLGRCGACEGGSESKVGIGILMAWAVAGLVWTPLNARGLWKRREWARKSTIAYWVIALPICCCFPVGAYGIWSLRRPGMRALFDADPR
jgi:hypothetical protein